MPVQYKGVLEEHRAVRTAVGLFDISHMGEIFVEGERAQEFINFITTNDIRKIKDGGCQYAACCFDNGTVVDDVISYQYNPQKYLVVVNASNTDKDFEWFQKNNKHGVKITNRSVDFCQLALQGPYAQKTLQPLVEAQLDTLQYYTFCETTFSGKKIILSRTGYTGEDGFEIYGAANDAQFFWDALLKSGAPYGIQPIGLAARDTLRLESAYSLYGHEISDSINPLEARLGWIVKLDKEGFIGQENLKKVAQNGVSRRIVGLEMLNPGIPRQGYKLVSGDRAIGEITSGTFSPTLEKPIGLGLVAAEFSKVGTEFQIEIRNKRQGVKVIPLPFYRKTA